MKRREFLSKTGAVAVSAMLTRQTFGATQMRTTAQTPMTKPMKIILWCWDARMTWDDEPDAILQTMASADRSFPYPKKAESFTAGFRRLIDYCAEAGIHGVIVWGFLRDAHGGVKAAADLCKYASDRGVAILPGVGLCSYGGCYFEGDHPFNLNSYLRKHPERVSMALAPGGNRPVTPLLDPSLEANRTWWRDGLEWMLETFQIGGVDFEMGDFIVNPSPEAKSARKALGFEADENIQDMVVATRDLITRAIKLKPDGVFINSTYRGYQQIMGFPRMDYVAALPKQTVWQYTLGNMVRKTDFPMCFEGAPDHRKYGYLHWFNISTATVDKDYVSEIARVFPGLHHLGFDFVGTYGELSARNNPVADHNYRAQVAWANNPNLALSDFR